MGYTERTVKFICRRRKKASLSKKERKTNLHNTENTNFIKTKRIVCAPRRLIDHNSHEPAVTSFTGDKAHAMSTSRERERDCGSTITTYQF